MESKKIKENTNGRGKPSPLTSDDKKLYTNKIPRFNDLAAASWLLVGPHWQQGA
jgi:hypothetical protein